MFRGCSRLSRPSTGLSRARPRWQRRRHPTTSNRRWRSRSSDRREDLGRQDAAHPALRDRHGRAAAAGDAEGCRVGRHRNAAGSAVAFVDLRHAEGDLSSFAARRDHSWQKEDGPCIGDLDQWFEGVEGRAGGPDEQLLAGETSRGRARADFSTFAWRLRIWRTVRPRRSSALPRGPC